VVQTSGANTLRLVPLGTTAVPEQRSLQFWTKADDWNAPVSLGLVRPGQPLEVKIDRLPPLVPNQLFEITLEPYNGSPTGRPTGPILYIGRSVKVI
jgi:anti-sigma-K factor RskA